MTTQHWSRLLRNSAPWSSSAAELAALAAYTSEDQEVEGFTTTGLDPSGLDVLGALSGALFPIGGTTHRKRPGRGVVSDLGDFHAG